jgi:uncharacterized protein YutE (UPF0331/DUF86 family)
LENAQRISRGKTSPKGVFKSALDANIITLEEYQKLVRMVEDRNLTSHAYDKLLAEEISALIPS